MGNHSFRWSGCPYFFLPYWWGGDYFFLLSFLLSLFNIGFLYNLGIIVTIIVTNNNYYYFPI